MFTTLFLLQSAVPPEAPLPTIVPQCTAAKGEEIVVCGARDNRKYRLDPLPDPKSGLGKAETDVAGGKLEMVAEQGEVGGVPTNRAMVRFKIKF